MSRCGCICILNGIAVFVRRINLDVATDIARIFLGILLQLFHHYYIMVILALSHFDQAVVVGICISVGSYRIRSLGVVILCTICIILSVGPLLPVYCISGYIVFVMAEGNRTGFIGSSLIADSRAVCCCDNGLITSSQTVQRISTCRTTSQAYRIAAIYAGTVTIHTIAAGTTNGYGTGTQCIVIRAAKGHGLVALSDIHDTAACHGSSSGSGVIPSTKYSRLTSGSIIIITAYHCGIGSGSHIIQAASYNTARTGRESISCPYNHRSFSRCAVLFAVFSF